MHNLFPAEMPLVLCKSYLSYSALCKHSVPRYKVTVIKMVCVGKQIENNPTYGKPEQELITRCFGHRIHYASAISHISIHFQSVENIKFDMHVFFLADCLFGSLRVTVDLYFLFTMIFVI